MRRAKKIVLDALRKCATEAAEQVRAKARINKTWSDEARAAAAAARQRAKADDAPPRRVGVDVPEGQSEDKFRPTTVPMSPYSYAAVGRAVYSDKFESGAKTEDVPVGDLRATQTWIDRGYDPKNSENSETPTGVRTPDGRVNVLDGHHRADWALRNGKSTVRMRVADMDVDWKKLAKAKGSTDPPPIDPPDPVDPDSVAEIEFTLEAISAMEDDLADALAEISDDASLELLGDVGLEDDAAITDIVNQGAVDAARDQAAELVSDIDDATRNMLQDVIADGLEDNVGLDGIVDAIVDSGAFSEKRAELIANTEVRNANERGVLEGLRGAERAGNRTKKTWLVGPSPCELCQENADAGPIDLDDEFPSGDTEPTAHPRCECAITGVIEEDDDGSAADDSGDDAIAELARMAGARRFAKGADDEARDDHGRWTAGGESSTVLYDTSNKMRDPETLVTKSSDFSEDEKSALETYKEEPGALSGGEKSDIRTAFAKSKLNADTTLWRGVAPNPDDPRVTELIANADKLVGKDLSHPSFVSTTTSIGVAMDFASEGGMGGGTHLGGKTSPVDGLILKISAQKGQSAISMQLGEKWSGWSQAEVLLPRGKLHVDSYDPRSKILSGTWRE